MGEPEYEALRSALASTRMEGFIVTEQMEKDCIRLMSGEVWVANLVKEILARPTVWTHLCQLLSRHDRPHPSI